jgi:hypothetical protein
VVLNAGSASVRPDPDVGSFSPLRNVIVDPMFQIPCDSVQYLGVGSAVYYSDDFV